MMDMMADPRYRPRSLNVYIRARDTLLRRRVQQRESSKPSSKPSEGASRAKDKAAEASAAQLALEEGFCICPQGVLSSCLEVSPRT